MLRKLFGLFFMFYAIAIPIRLLMEENFLDQLNIVLVVEIIIVEFLFLFFGIKLLRKKRVKKKRGPERNFYGGDYGGHLDRETPNPRTYSSYNSNTVNYSSHNTINYTEINFSDKENTEEKADEKVEEPQRPVSVSCPGCGAKAKVFPKQSTDCEYCGTTVVAT
ncbi:hypothetical protein MKX33_23180 [Paenibacillus sp. FSL R5-0490]|uniref:hypothetical protein n=1 Tax=unclassified Paenibacillus TaxID=185978 RepID=UPI0006495170|nr:hypothetical protein [Paenibacillus sp. VT-400]KLU55259.1 hypothetical protein EL84_24680 [Paenibacillus sp. VT-400]